MPTNNTGAPGKKGNHRRGKANRNKQEKKNNLLGCLFLTSHRNKSLPGKFTPRHGHVAEVSKTRDRDITGR